MGEASTLIGVLNAAILFPSLKLLFALCAAVLDALRCIVLGLHGNLGPGGLNGTYK